MKHKKHYFIRWNNPFLSSCPVMLTIACYFFQRGENQIILKVSLEQENEGYLVPPEHHDHVPPQRRRDIRSVSKLYCQYLIHASGSDHDSAYLTCQYPWRKMITIQRCAIALRPLEWGGIACYWKLRHKSMTAEWTLGLIVVRCAWDPFSADIIFCEDRGALRTDVFGVDIDAGVEQS